MVMVVVRKIKHEDLQVFLEWRAADEAFGCFFGLVGYYGVVNCPFFPQGEGLSMG